MVGVKSYAYDHHGLLRVAGALEPEMNATHNAARRWLTLLLFAGFLGIFCRAPSLGGFAVAADSRNTTRRTEMNLRAVGTVAAMSIAGAASNANAQNQVLNLDAGGWVQIAHHASQNPGANMTIEFWMRSSPTTICRPISKRPGSGGCYDVQIGPWLTNPSIGGSAATFFGDACANGGTVFFPTNQWVHLAYVSDGSLGIRYYRNGVLQESLGAPGCTITSGTYPLCFGRTPGYAETQFFGRLDNVRIWSTARTAEQLATTALVEFNPDHAAVQQGLIGSWNFNAGTAVDARNVNNGAFMSGASTALEQIPNLNEDCNGNGILDDYEISTGALPDANSDGFPDCCEGGGVCAPSAIQWRVEDGGNGHWYWIDHENLHWQPHRARAENAGGYLATITSAAEQAFVESYLTTTDSDIWLGGQNNWPLPITWVSGEKFGYTHWAPNGYTPNVGYAVEMCGRWNCLPTPFVWNIESETDLSWLGNDGLVEWSADCNADGIVDYGQILSGELVDTNANNIPDCCDAGISCDPCLGDISGDGEVNGVEIAILMDLWATSSEGNFDADLNNDGTVSGADLSIVLDRWGECP